MRNKRTLSFYTIFFMSCMVLMRGSGLLSKMVLTRWLTPYEYGIITLVTLVLPGLFQSLTNFVVHEILLHSKEGKKYFGFSIVYSSITTLFVIAILIIFRDRFLEFLNLPGASWHILLLAFFIALFSVSILADITGLLRGVRKYNMASSVAALPTVLKLALIIGAVYLLSVTDFVSLLMIFALSSFIVLIVALVKEPRLIFSSLRNIALPSKNIIYFGFSIFIVITFWSMSQHATGIVISHDLGVLWQGYFDVSLTLVSILSFAFLAMQFISIPEATSAKNKEDILFKSGELGGVVRGLFAFLILCVIVLFFYSTQLTELLFTKEYIVAADYVIILAIGYIFLFIQQFLVYVNISFSEEIMEYKQFILVTIMFLIVYPFAAHYSIRVMGFSGAYISLTLLLALYTMVTIMYSKDLSPLYALFHKGSRLIIVSLIIFLFLFLLKLPLVYGALSATLIYAFLIFFLGYLDKELVLGLFK